MKKRNHNGLLHQLICLLMALHVVNLSLDAPDRYVTVNVPGSHHEDLSINEMESFGELLLEQILGIDDALPEHEDSEDESDLAPIGPDYFFHQPFAFSLIPSNWYVVLLRQAFQTVFPQTHVLTVTAPPPQASR